MRSMNIRWKAAVVAGIAMAVLVTLTAEPVRAADPPELVWYLGTADQGAALFVREIGTGMQVIVCHGGWGAEHSYLIKAFDGLFDRYRFIFYDMRGSLRSPAPDNLISVDKHVADLDRLIDTLGLKSVVLVGHSTGGFLAMLYRERHPDKVRGLVLISSMLPKKPLDEGETAGLADASDELRAFMSRQAIQDEIEKEGLEGRKLNDREKSMVWRIKFAGPNIYHVERWRQVEGGLAYFSQAASQAATATMPKSWNFVPGIESAGYPVTVIVGSHDLVDWHGIIYRRLFGDAPSIHIKVLKNAGHEPWVDRPFAFTAAMDEALQRYVKPRKK